MNRSEREGQTVGAHPSEIFMAISGERGVNLGLLVRWG